MNIPTIITNFLGSEENICLKVQELHGQESIDEIREIASKTILEIIQPYYSGMNIHVNHAVFNFILEPLKNAHVHSEDHKKITFQTMMSTKGLVASYNDGGQYFKRLDVKNCYENRIKHPEKHKANIPGIGYGAGTMILYDLADFIHVDKNSGTLYAGLSIDNKVFQ
jgi:hypothetical protein